jgi:hypothetical protein
MIFKRLALTLAAVLAGIGGVAAVAQAQPTNQVITINPVAMIRAGSGGPSGNLCIYANTDFRPAYTGGGIYVFSTWNFRPGQCYRLGIDPTGFNWEDRVNSIWYNHVSGLQATFWRNSCYNTIVTRLLADGNWWNQQQSCVEIAAYWMGNCGASGISTFTIDVIRP